MLQLSQYLTVLLLPFHLPLLLLFLLFLFSFDFPGTGPETAGASGIFAGCVASYSAYFVFAVSVDVAGSLDVGTSLGDEVGFGGGSHTASIVGRGSEDGSLEGHVEVTLLCVLPVCNLVSAAVADLLVDVVAGPVLKNSMSTQLDA